MNSQRTIEVLVVARWPLGGIRTYLKYLYRYLPRHFRVTILASSTLEDDALRRDALEVGARLVLVPPRRPWSLVFETARELRRGRYRLIHSQGFISGFQAYLANLLFRLPHVLTVHGILEEKYLRGRLAPLKSWTVSWVIRHVSVLYLVSNDMLSLLTEQIPSLAQAPCRRVVIANGVEVGEFTPARGEGAPLRGEWGIDRGTYLVGFMGRFMQQKGFNFLIDAVQLLENDPGVRRDFHVLAAGSGDYLPFYQEMAREKGVAHRFTFIPFQKDVAGIYREVDLMVMPSIWEASGLLAMEALCSGTPLVASDCVGLRETVAGTPALVFPSRDATAFARAIRSAMERDARPEFLAFAPRAQERYDVRKTAAAVGELFGSLAR